MTYTRVFFLQWVKFEKKKNSRRMSPLGFWSILNVCTKSKQTLGIDEIETFCRIKDGCVLLFWKSFFMFRFFDSNTGSKAKGWFLEEYRIEKKSDLSKNMVLRKSTTWNEPMWGIPWRNLGHNETIKSHTDARWKENCRLIESVEAGIWKLWTYPGFEKTISIKRLQNH